MADLQVEIHVERQIPRSLPAPLCESDIMPDPWTDFPSPEPIILVEAERQDLALPDIPRIPVD